MRGLVAGVGRCGDTWSMAKYTIAVDEIGAHAKTLKPEEVDEVEFEGANSVGLVEVETNGAEDIYVTADGSTPTIGGANCYRLPPVRSVRIIRPPENENPIVTVKLRSKGAAEYSVARP